MMRTPDLNHGIESITFHFLTERPTEALLLWHAHNEALTRIYQMPFTIQPDAGTATVALDLTAFPAWDPRTDRLGFAMPAGADVTLQSIELDHWSFTEKLTEGWKSFWTFDTFRSHSINFLWGPVLAFNPVGRATIFAQLPARGMSALRIFYFAIALIGIALLLRWFLQTHVQPARRKPWPYVKIFLLGTAAVWVLFDLRMGAELLSYAVTDYRTYVFQPQGQKMLRDHESFEDTVFRAMPVLQSRPVFLFFGPDHTPFTARLRYFAYPSKPAATDEEAHQTDTVFVFERPDVDTDAQQQLTVDGKAVTGPGKVLERFGPSTFLFRIGS
jgi:hypothetical protein